MISGPISRVGVRAVADAQLRQPCRDGVDEAVADVADGDRHRDRHAALARRAVGRGHRRVGGQVERRRRAARACGSWRRRAPAPACRRPFRVRRCSCAIGVEPTKLTAATSGWSSNASTASLSPCTTLNTPSGRPACFHSSARNSAADGSFSLGLRTNALPQAIAFAAIQSGTIAGKLNGVMPATTPSGCRIEYTSTPVAACSLKPPLSSCGTPQANSTFSRPRAISPRGVGEHLAVLGGDDRGEFVGVRGEQLAECEQHRGAARQRRLAPLAAAARRWRPRRSTSAAEARSTAPVCSPVAGLNTGPLTAADLRLRRAVDPVGDSSSRHVVPAAAFTVRMLFAARAGPAPAAGRARAAAPRCRGGRRAAPTAASRRVQSGRTAIAGQPARFHGAANGA